MSSGDRSALLKIAIFTQYYKPENATIPNTLAQELATRGHSVSVVTTFPSYPGSTLYPGWRQKLRHYEKDGEVLVKRVPVFLSHSQNAIGRVLNYLSFAASSRLASRFVKGVDVIYVYSSPMTAAIGARRIALRRRVPLVLHIQDMWPESVTGSSMIRSRLVSRLAYRSLSRWLQNLYRSASAIVAIAPSMAELLIARGAASSKVETVLNWAAEPQLVKMKVQSSAPLSLRIMYAGNIGDLQDLETAILAAARFKELTDFEFRIYGSGIAEDELREIALAAGATNIFFMGRISEEEIAHAYEWSDFQLVSLKSLNIFQGTIPSKFQASMAHGRPVISNVEGDLAALIKRHSLGFVCAPGDVDALEKVFETAMDLPSFDREELRRNAQSFFRSHLSLTHGIDAFEKLLIEIVATQERSKK